MIIMTNEERNVILALTNDYSAPHAMRAKNRVDKLFELRGSCKPSFQHCNRCCNAKQCHEPFKVVVKP